MLELRDFRLSCRMSAAPNDKGNTRVSPYRARARPAKHHAEFRLTRPARVATVLGPGVQGEAVYTHHMYIYACIGSISGARTASKTSCWVSTYSASASGNGAGTVSARWSCMYTYKYVYICIYRIYIGRAHGQQDIMLSFDLLCHRVWQRCWDQECKVGMYVYI